MALKISVFLTTLQALITAKYIMLTKNITRLTLPEINKHRKLSSEIIHESMQWAKRWVNLFSIKSHHGCYYRSFALACILRRRGIPVSLNIGLRNLRSQEKNRGHCWLTLKGNPVFESDAEALRLYPHLLKQGQSEIYYWIGSDDARRIKRHKMTARH